MIIYSILLLLLSNAVTTRRDKSILYSRNAIIMLLYSTFIAFFLLDVNFLDTGLSLYGGLFHTNCTTQTLQVFIFMICLFILQLNCFHPRKILHESFSNISKLLSNKFYFNEEDALQVNSRGQHTNIINKMAQQYKVIEYPLILLFIITGAVFLISSSDLVSIFLSIELQSYGLYLLSTLYRDSELSTSAGLTYFLLGGLSSCFILLGTSLLYANSGTTNLDGYYVITSICDTADNYTKDMLDWYKPFYLNMSLLIMSVGFLFKISAAPFHFWSPDVYDAIPTIVTTFVALVAKISILVFLLEVVHYTSNILSVTGFNWTSGLLLSSYLSLIIGSVLGLAQFRIKRLFAYSTISHLGFILLALVINSLESVQAFIFYLMQYSISNLNAFMLLISIGYSLYPYVIKSSVEYNYGSLRDVSNSPIQLTDQLKGYYLINPVLALSLTVTLFSFVGIPPLIGFFAKQMVLSSALDSGYLFLTIVAIITSVISAVYYLGVVKQIFFQVHDYELCKKLVNVKFAFSLSNALEGSKQIKIKIENIILSTSLSVTISVLTLVLLLFMFDPNQLISVATVLSLIIFNP